MSDATLKNPSLADAAPDSGSFAETMESGMWVICRALASLKLTMVLFALAIFLILAGTLAQAEAGMWEAIEHYFSAWFVPIRVEIFFPRAWFPEFRKTFPTDTFYLPFPGGASIGLAMMVNLVFAHLFRFKLQAKGKRLWAGLAAMAFASLVGLAVISLGQFQQGVRSEPILTWEATSTLILLSGAAITLGLYVGAIGLISKASSQRDLGTWAAAMVALLAAVLATLGCFALYVFRSDIGALRILWQLVQGTVVGVLMLGACWLLFQKRAGIVLLHGGVALMMFGQFLVTRYAVEEQMQIAEGESAVFGHDIRTTELAVIERQGSTERHVTVPQQMLAQGASLAPEKIDKTAASPPKSGLISDKRLPFDIEVLRFFPNAKLEDVDGKRENIATSGVGLSLIAEPTRKSAGADSDSTVDTPAAYLRLWDKATGKPLGTFMASVAIGLQDMADRVKVDGRKFEFLLRFERYYKDYAVTLKDVRKDDYAGTNVPRNYSSEIRLVDAAQNVDRPVHISMNNPLRYGGETFYQSGYAMDPRTGKEITTLQVVTNTGWMIPYVGCMVVATGMLFQFLLTLMKFIKTESTPSKVPLPADAVSPLLAARRQSWKSWFVPSWPAIVGIAFCLMIIAAGLRSPRRAADAFDMEAFGRLPVVSEGRAKPLDSLARDTLTVLAGRQLYKVEGEERSRPAIEWLLETIANPEAGEKLQVIRIENPEVLTLLGLEERPGNFRYSLAEVRETAKEYDEQMESIRKKNAADLNIFEKEMVELDRRLQTHVRIVEAFRVRPLPPFPPREKLEARDPEAVEQAMAIAERMSELHNMISRMRPPLAVPDVAKLVDKDGSRSWEALSTAVHMAQAREAVFGQKAGYPLKAWEAMRTAYHDGKAAEFNKAVAEYSTWLAENKPEFYDAGKVSFEAFLNRFAPFGWSQGILLYFVAFIVSLVSLMTMRDSLGKAAFWMLVIVFLLHTFALAARMIISGRPPVTNLYSSAVFIGWFTVLMCIVLEAVFRLGISNVIASLAGMLTLLIAHSLSFDGDTIGVMQAVLDTQFWLATHVVCITVGYSATFLAGLFGIAYILLGVFTKVIDAPVGKILSRITYGIVCFALFFSFVGTVLGGLWADDSWGRFWGWDPKENGALIIVLWNVFILHARWDRIANERGLAVLAVFGNIVTSWSWFGTNQLGVGLHSYGFTSGVLMTLFWFVTSQMLIIGLGLLPKALWRSFAARNETPVSAEMVEKTA